MEFAKNFKKSFLLVSLCFLALGFVLLLYPTLSMRAICYTLGGITTLYGIFHLITYFSRTDFGEVYRFDFVVGVLLLCAGIYVIAQPLVVAQSLPVILGLAILVDSLIKLQNAIDLKRLASPLWWIVLVLAFITAALGITLMLDPFYTVVTLTRFIGVALVVDGCVNLWSFSFLSIQLKKLRAAVQQNIQGSAYGSHRTEPEIFRPSEEELSPIPENAVLAEETTPF